MRINLQKRQNKFIKLINDQACLTLEGLEALKAYMERKDGGAAGLLRDKEKEADEARRILIDELNRTFVTPFDREDIFSLSRAIDDVLDYAYSTADEMEILKVEPTPYMCRIASLLRDAAYELFMAVNRLEGHARVAGEHAQRAKALENRVEGVYREALADLDEHRDDLAPRELLRVEPVAQRPAREVLHREEDLALVDADVEDADDVRVRHLRHRLRLAHEAGATAVLVAAAGGAQDLDRDLTVELGIVRGVDDAHGAGAEALEDQIPP